MVQDYHKMGVCSSHSLCDNRQMLVQEDTHLRTHAQIQNTKHSQLEAEHTMVAVHYIWL
jgi:hypothetical protein